MLIHATLRQQMTNAVLAADVAICCYRTALNAGRSSRVKTCLSDCQMRGL